MKNILQWGKVFKGIEPSLTSEEFLAQKFSWKVKALRRRKSPPQERGCRGQRPLKKGWRLLSIFKNTRNLYGMYELKREIKMKLEKFMKNLWEIMKHFDKFWKSFCKFWNFDKSWNIWKYFDKFWNILIKFDRFWNILINFEIIWEILKNFDK